MIRRVSSVLTVAVLLAACAHSSTLPLSNSNSLDSRPIGGASSPVQFFGTPSGLEWPAGITAGPDGNLWFTSTWAGYVGRITPQGTIAEFPLNSGDTAEFVVTGPDKNLWFTEPSSDQIGRMTTKGVLTNFRVNGLDPRGIAVGPDGNLWFTELDDNYVDRITTKGAVRRFPLSDQGEPWGIIAGPDRNMWITESATGRIARFNPKTLQFVSPIVLEPNDNPWALTIGPDGNVWFTGRSSGKIGTVVNGKPLEFSIPNCNACYPDAITLGSDGRMWFTESLTSGIQSFDPNTRKFLPQLLLNSEYIPNVIAAGPDGNVWFTNDSYNGSDNMIGKVTLRHS